ncbi:MAG: hypothetical protein KatS3mg023_2637 [Armatimonadota bacterium]|nr:MAG: hypothetical protein KatS3mg023_2637 [Armatimonadota bacterium]
MANPPSGGACSSCLGCLGCLVLLAILLPAIPTLLIGGLVFLLVLGILSAIWNQMFRTC